MWGVFTWFCCVWVGVCPNLRFCENVYPAEGASLDQDTDDYFE